MKEVHHRWQQKHSAWLMLCLWGEGTFIYTFSTDKALHEPRSRVLRCFLFLNPDYTYDRA